MTRVLRLTIATAMLAPGLGAAPAAALAQRAPTTPERNAIVRAFQRASRLRLPGRCFDIAISTADTTWGDISFDPRHRNRARACRTYVASAVNVVHLRGGRWRFVLAPGAADIRSCRTPGVPRAVVSDLRLCA